MDARAALLFLHKDNTTAPFVANFYALAPGFAVEPAGRVPWRRRDAVENALAGHGYRHGLWQYRGGWRAGLHTPWRTVVDALMGASSLGLH